MIGGCFAGSIRPPEGQETAKLEAAAESIACRILSSFASAEMFQL